MDGQTDELQDPVRQDENIEILGPGDQIIVSVESGHSIRLRIGRFDLVMSERDALAIRNLLAGALEAIR